jgi:hypothetical protein
MFLGGGADVSVVGADFQQMDFKQVQGADETLIAAAAGVPPVIVGFSEGLSGSSLNQGNYQSAKRQFGDTTIAYLAGDMSASLEAVLRPPAPNARLWWDMRDVPFFRQDAKDEAEIHSMEAATMRTLVDGGFDPASVIAAITNQDMSLIQHTGNLSVQLQPPGTGVDGEQPAERAELDDAVVAVKVNSAAALIRSGFIPEAALSAVGLDPIDHFGLLPVTLQSPKVVEAEAQAAEASINDDADPDSAPETDGDSDV